MTRIEGKIPLPFRQFRGDLQRLFAMITILLVASIMVHAQEDDRPEEETDQPNPEEQMLEDFAALIRHVRDECCFVARNNPKMILNLPDQNFPTPRIEEAHQQRIKTEEAEPSLFN